MAMVAMAVASAILTILFLFGRKTRRKMTKNAGTGTGTVSIVVNITTVIKGVKNPKVKKNTRKKVNIKADILTAKRIRMEKTERAV